VIRIVVIACFSCLLILGLSSFFYQDDKKAAEPVIEAKIIRVINGWYKLRVSLVNNSNDTLYYLSTSCNPFIDNMEFDPRIIVVNTHECIASNHIKLKIVPHSSTTDTIDAYVTRQNMDYNGVKFKVGYRWCPLTYNTPNEFAYDGVQRPKKNIWSDTLFTK